LQRAGIVSPLIAIQVLPVSVVGGVLTWCLWRHARFCRHCGASTKTAVNGQELTWCPACYTLIDPARVGVFDLRTAGYWDRRETVPRFLALVTLCAIYEKARQVRFEPTPSSYEIYLSIGDETYEMVPAPVFIQFANAQIVKAMAGLDMSTFNRPREGDIKILAPDRTITTRVVVEPTEYGQRVFFRFLAADLCSEMS
jgi:type II secretory ATPase GspE/PulE/Tfp pilus assembly ATPase PilB-like protein